MKVEDRLMEPLGIVKVNMKAIFILMSSNERSSLYPYHIMLKWSPKEIQVFVVKESEPEQLGVVPVSY